VNLSPFEIVYLAGFAAGSAARVWYARPHRRGRIVRSRQTGLDTALLGVAGVALYVPLVCVFSPSLDVAKYPAPAWVGWAGAVVFAAAVWLLWWSHADLGQNWSARLEIHDSHKLVTDGVYAHIRHPMYAAHWLWAVAQVLLIHNWIAGPALLVGFLPLYLARVRREEAMLADQFGEAYRAYRTRTGRIIPRW